jgi:hypothetical protein
MVPIINRYVGNGLKFCWYRGDLWSKISKKEEQDLHNIVLNPISILFSHVTTQLFIII